MRARWVRWSLALVCLVWLGILAAPALAQRTGGSFGGGSFGGGSSFGGGGSFGGGSSFGGGYTGGGGSGLPCGCSAPVLIGIVVVLILVNRQKHAGGPTHGARSWSEVDVSAVRLGIDWRARRALQAKLDQLARSGKTTTPEGRAELLRETVLELRRTELSWLYCNIANYHPMSPAMAEGIFRQLGVEARSKFQEELVRDSGGARSTREASALRAEPEEGEGVVVVTLVVAARREIVDVTAVDDADRIKALLDDLAAVANPFTLVALEVVWSPAAEEDRMSTAELEAVYPDLKKIDERSIAGRVFCSYCRGPFAAELLTCPHCGAPAPGAEAQPTT